MMQQQKTTISNLLIIGSNSINKQYPSSKYELLRYYSYPYDNDGLKRAIKKRTYKNKYAFIKIPLFNIGIRLIT